MIKSSVRYFKPVIRNSQKMSSLITAETDLMKEKMNTKFGPVNRHSNSGITATVFGAYGSSGRYIVNELGACGTRVYVPFRGCELEVRHLKPMFDLGQLGLMPYSPRDEASIVASLENSDVVINMIGKHYETKHIVPTRRADGRLCRINYDFEETHVEIPRKIARLAKKNGVKTFIHLSALSADLESSSRWCQSKARGEIAVREEFPEAIIVKAATVFGPEDRFLNWIAETADRLPFMPILNDGKTLVQPVHSVDIAKALMQLVLLSEKFKGKTFQLVGPAEYSYKEVFEFVTDITTKKKPMINIPTEVASFIGKFSQELINPVWTEDFAAQLCEDVLPQEGMGYLGFEELKIDPTSMDKVAFDYLHRYRPGGHFANVQGYY